MSEEAIDGIAGEDATKGRIGRAKEVLGEKYGEASESVKAKYADASKIAKEKFADASKVAKEKYEKVKGKVDEIEFEEVTEKVRAYVRENPGKAILISVGVGFLIGLLLRRDDD